MKERGALSQLVVRPQVIEEVALSEFVECAPAQSQRMICCGDA